MSLRFLFDFTFHNSPSPSKLAVPFVIQPPAPPRSSLNIQLKQKFELLFFSLHAKCSLYEGASTFYFVLRVEAEESVYLRSFARDWHEFHINLVTSDSTCLSIYPTACSIARPKLNQLVTANREGERVSERKKENSKPKRNFPAPNFSLFLFNCYLNIITRFPPSVAQRKNP